jgi:hypothetical protein
MMYDSLLADASVFFFAVWSVVVGAISIAAFGPELLLSKAPSDLKQVGTAASAVRATKPR